MYQIRIYHITNDGEFTYHIYNDYKDIANATKDFVDFAKEFKYYNVEDYVFIPKILKEHQKDIEKLTRRLDKEGKILVTIHEEVSE